MALDFKRGTKKKNWKPQARGSKEYSQFNGRHLSTRKLLGRCYVGRYNSYIHANMTRWLHTQVGRPVDKVYSEFLKMWKKSASGDTSPRSYFDTYVSSSKDYLSRFYPIYYVSNGILCKRKPSKMKTWIPSHESNWSKEQLDYNKAHCLKLNTLEDGPISLGKLWARISGYTRLVNVWMISNTKLGKEHGGFTKVSSKKTKLFLEDFVEVTLAGIAPYTNYYVSPSGHPSHKNYLFIVRLSDIKQI